MTNAMGDKYVSEMAKTKSLCVDTLVYLLVYLLDPSVCVSTAVFRVGGGSSSQSQFFSTTFFSHSRR